MSHTIYKKFTMAVRVIAFLLFLLGYPLLFLLNPGNIVGFVALGGWAYVLADIAKIIMTEQNT